jgi:transcriptional regulator with XRE-family HTH domain
VVVDRSPTVRRRRLGIELRRLRETAGLMIEDVATHLECSSSKVSRIETGKAVPRVRDVRDMLELYDVTDTQSDLLLTIVREAQQKGWWTDYEDVLPAAFETYVGLEAEASSLRTFQHHVHGLLQTEDYARAMLRGGHLSDSDGVERLVALRMRRQDMLTKPNPIELWAVIDEAALHRLMGGAEVMRGQVARLVELADLPNVTLQVLPFTKGAHAGVIGAFTLIEFPDQTDNDVVYVDSPAGNIYLEKDKDLRRYTLVFDHLRAAALPPDESIPFIEDVARALHDLKTQR